MGRRFIWAVAVAGAAAAAGGRPLERAFWWNGVLGASGEFRTVFDNTEYSSVRIPKPDELTYFFSDLTLYADFHLAERVTASIGGKAKYDFGADVPGAGGPRAYLRLRGTYDGEYQHWTFGHFRDDVTPLTFQQRDYDDELAGMRARVVYGPADVRLFLARTSTVGEGRFETFAAAGRAAYTPWKVTTVAGNLGGVHEGGFDAGVGSPPEGGRKREVAVGSVDLRQDIRWGFYAAAESAMSIGRSDLVDGTVRDNAFWGGVGWARGPVNVVGRFWRVGWAFESPWGERWLRNEEGVAILHDYYAVTGTASFALNLADAGVLTFGGQAGVKYKKTALRDVDYDFNVELIKFEAAL